jgi:hypothetical protein
MGRFRLGALIALGYFGLLSAACAQVIGIEDAEVDPTFNADCEEYCGLINSVCIDGNTQYVAREACINMCLLMPPGNEGDLIDNTLACRLTNAEAANLEREAQPCALAGPAGVDVNDNGCGSVCESYCFFLDKICNVEFRDTFGNISTCLTRCEAEIPSRPEPFSTQFTTGNSVECRLYHLGAATIAPATHCPHAIGFAECVDGAGGAGGAGGGMGGAGGSGGN